MKREILFRGMRVDNGEWVYGDLVHDAISAYSTMMKVGIRQGGCYPDEVKPETVGQYTGMKDMHDVKIFEHDLLETGYYVGLRQVEFISMMFQVHTVPLIKYRIGYCVVKGNIHTP